MRSLGGWTKVQLPFPRLRGTLARRP